jgi:hypothetical protein
MKLVDVEISFSHKIDTAYLTRLAPMMPRALVVLMVKAAVPIRKNARRVRNYFTASTNSEHVGMRVSKNLVSRMTG